MPRHRVINRRNEPLDRRSIGATTEGFDGAQALAERLGVSLGSIVDTALRDLAARSTPEVLDALAAHGHLTNGERKLVEEHLRSPKGGKS